MIKHLGSDYFDKIGGDGTGGKDPQNPKQEDWFGAVEYSGIILKVGGDHDSRTSEDISDGGEGLDHEWYIEGDYGFIGGGSSNISGDWGFRGHTSTFGGSGV